MTRYVRHALLALTVLLVGCQGPEQLILKKYFNALQFQDKATIASISLEPIALTVVNWEITSVGPESTQVAQLKSLVDAEDVAKAKLDELRAKGREAQDAMNAADEVLKGSGKKGKGDAQADYDQKKAAFDQIAAQIKEAQAALSNAKASTAREKKIVSLSLGTADGLEGLEGDYRTKEVMVKVTAKAADGTQESKDYRVVLRTYKLNNPVTNRPMRGKWIIVEMKAT